MVRPLLSLLLPARNVETHCDDVHAFAALGEPMLDGKRIQTSRGELDDFGQAQNGSNLLYLAAGCGQMKISVKKESC